MSFPSYPTYKDSGVEWLGEVPQSWSVYSIKRTVDGCINGLWGDEPDGENDIAVIRVADFERSFSTVGLDKLTYRSITPKERQSRLIKSGDLLIEKSGGGEKTLVGCVVLFTHEFDAITSNFVARMRPLAEFDSQFLCYAFGNLYHGRVNYPSVKQVTGIQNLDAESYLQERFCFPTRVEQTQIARFLNHETARIDALIEEQQRLIELLKEKRQAVISHAVTKGLDPTVPMKDSGVKWLGEVPAHWKVSKLGHYAQILTGFPFPSASFSHDESDVRLLRGANIGVGSLKWIDTVYWSLSEGDSLSSYLMGEGQIVLGMDRPWISEGMRIARVTKEDMPCLLLQRVAAISPSAELDDEYLFCLLASELFKAYVEPDLTGVSVPHISPEQIMSFQISVPEIGEQRRISSFIRNQLDQMAALFKQASESVELLQERRSALISAAVTGKIDVRGWQPPASVQTPELEREAV
ncbi:restriction endonuclease subunit S [Pseudomonas syringae]|uniref:Restriction endonuclease subunit S n=2 Tax=Pseudomonas syringae TaxID=317 RepID=A0A6B2AZ27_PSESX|nr:restriction endonuclease subunit S [Pseudomonas syringae]MBI6558226.1 restriction endonuclease subunit S [Pseudomonas syringae]MBI6569962.1 restriction endonuclease subunit S [Pseudomonas syringae]MBI6585013.1 restriction endonuclease subunit S [Pseudomonas syringae]MBI6592217.1 restriction endonuclease subunit S [Pseudomonas syringae]MDC6490927.1 restriction endonuclease subunit S [Pseudomonas syringae]